MRLYYYLQKKLPNCLLLLILAMWLLQVSRCSNPQITKEFEGVNAFPIEEGMIEEAKKQNLDLLSETLQKIENYQKGDEEILDINEKDEKANDQTPLHQAIYLGKPELIKALIHQQADIHAKAANGVTPLHVAVYKGNKEIVKILLEKGADINAATKKLQRTPIHIAAERGDSDLLNLLLDKDAKLDTPAHRGATALHLTANRGHVEAMKLLISKGASIDIQDLDGITPLHLAAHKGQLEIMDILIKKNANLRSVASKSSSKSFTPLHLAVEGGQVEAVKKLLEADQKHINHTPAGTQAKPYIELEAEEETKPLHVAAYLGKVGVLNFLIEKGAYINSTDRDGFTALHWAALKGYPKVVESLLRKGANRKIKDNRKNTPKKIAKKALKRLSVEKSRKKDYEDIVKLLSKKG